MNNKVVSNLKLAGLKAKNGALTVSAMASVAMAQLATTVYADEATDLMETVIKIIANLIFIPAAIMSITGIIQYASAHSDGDGPAQKKAINMLAAGIMLAALAIILKATSATFSGMISTAI